MYSSNLHVTEQLTATSSSAKHSGVGSMFIEYRTNPVIVYDIMDYVPSNSDAFVMRLTGEIEWNYTILQL